MVRKIKYFVARRKFQQVGRFSRFQAATTFLRLGSRTTWGTWSSSTLRATSTWWWGSRSCRGGSTRPWASRAPTTTASTARATSSRWPSGRGCTGSKTRYPSRMGRWTRCADFSKNYRACKTTEEEMMVLIVLAYLERMVEDNLTLYKNCKLVWSNAFFS